MPRKERVVRRIDERNDNLVTGGGQPLINAIDNIVAPHIPTIDPPENITVVSQALLRTTLVPKVIVNVTWDNPPNVLPELYQVQAAKNSTLTSGVLTFSTSSPSAAIELATNTDYWLRVRAVVRGAYGAWGYLSNYPTVSLHTINDTTAPGSVSGVTTNWSTGDLRWNWTNPTSDNFFQTRIRIYDTSGGTLYVEDYIVGNPGSASSYVFTAAMNNRVTGNSPLTTVYYELLAYSLAGVPAASSVTGTVTKTKPAIPTGLANTWTGDDGTYDEGVTIAWNAVTGASTYRFVIDGIVKETPRTLYTYNYTENISDHRPTLVSGDFSLAYTVQARDPLNQLGGGASGTATNLAPSSSNLSVAVVAGFSSLFAYVTPTVEIKDLYGYRWILKSGGVNVQSTLTFTPEVIFTTLNGSYVLESYAIDLFGRKSASQELGVTLDGLTIEQLRADMSYTSFGHTTFDGDKLKDGLVTQAAVYPLGTTWKLTKGERALLDRYRTISLHCFTASGTTRGYIGTSIDDVTYRWFAGPLTGTYSNTLTEHATETIARVSGVLIDSHPNINRYDLPEILEARYVKVGHRDLSTAYSINEFYPRRLVQSDDLEAETIKGINIAAATLTADKIQVFSLAASNATISGVITIATTGGIWQGTGTFASPTTGLKVYNTGGIGRLTTYSGSVVQVDLDTTGRLKAGAGLVILDSNGITIDAPQTNFNTIQSYGFAHTNTWFGGVQGQWDTSLRKIRLYAETTNIPAQIDIHASVGGGNQLSTAAMTSSNGATITGFASSAENGTLANTWAQIAGRLAIGASIDPVTMGGADGDIFVAGDISIGMASGATNGIITAGAADIPLLLNTSSAQVVVENSDTNANTTTLQLLRRNDGTGTVAANFGSTITFSLDTNGGSDRTGAQVQTILTDATDASRNFDLRFLAFDTAGREGFRISGLGAAAGISFFGGAGTAKQTVTGVRTGTLAQLQTVMANLLTAIANYSLITDSTT